MVTTNDNNENSNIIYDEKSKKFIKRLDLTVDELAVIHKALTLIYKTCKSIKNITYNKDESVKLSCGRSLGTISFYSMHLLDYNDFTTNNEVFIENCLLIIFIIKLT